MPNWHFESRGAVAGVTIRGQRVILDSDLAKIYGVPTFRFNEAVRRTIAPAAGPATAQDRI
jgi:hypothetical protein